MCFTSILYAILVKKFAKTYSMTICFVYVCISLNYLQVFCAHKLGFIHVFPFSTELVIINISLFALFEELKDAAQSFCVNITINSTCNTNRVVLND